MDEKQNLTIRALLDIPAESHTQAKVLVTRLGLEIQLQDISYNKLAKLRGKEDAELQYLLASAVTPDFKAPEWFREHMGCPTPVEALKKLLRAGEVRSIIRTCDQLNGYGGGAVVSLDLDDATFQAVAIDAALEDLEKNGAGT